jgi:hypothetical protein
MSRMRLALVLAATFGSCASQKFVEFEIDARDNRNQPIECVIIVDKERKNDSAGQPLLTPQKLRVEFQEKASGGFEPIEIVLRSVRRSGGALVGLKPDEPQPWLMGDPRIVFPGDPRRQLFIGYENRDQ